MTFELPPLPATKTEWVNITVHVRMTRRDLLQRLFPNAVSKWINGLIDEALPGVIDERVRRVQLRRRVDHALDSLSIGAVCLGSREETSLPSSRHVRNRPARPCRPSGQRRGRQCPAAKASPRAESEAKACPGGRARAKSPANRRSRRSKNGNPAAA